MSPSQAILDFIKGWERCELSPYKDAGGKWTVGWGHLLPPGANLDSINQETADTLFDDDVERTAMGMLLYLSGIPSQQQFDAVLSLAFNMGVTAIAGSTLIMHMNRGEFKEASYEFPKWRYVRVGGVLCANDGLWKRRLAEQRIFDAGIYDSRH